MVAAVCAHSVHPTHDDVISKRPWCLGGLLCDNALTMMKMEMISSWGRASLLLQLGCSVSTCLPDAT